MADFQLADETFSVIIETESLIAVGPYHRGGGGAGGGGEL